MICNSETALATKKCEYVRFVSMAENVLRSICNFKCGVGPKNKSQIITQ